MAEDRRDEETAEADESPAGQEDVVETDAPAADNAGAAEAPGEAVEPGAGTADDGNVTAEDEIAQLRAELDGAKDAALRAHADAQNAKRRAEQDVEKARKYALERFCSELLPVVDNLERALEAGGGDDEALRPIREGVELTLKSMRDALRKFSIEPVDPVGEPFDPQLHQAMSMVENPDAEPNTVLTVMQKGYTLHGRLVRPAMVIVSKAPAAQ